MLVVVVSIVPTGLVMDCGLFPGDESPGYFHSVPTGLDEVMGSIPGDKSLRYYQTSLRDFPK